MVAGLPKRQQPALSDKAGILVSDDMMTNTLASTHRTRTTIYGAVLWLAACLIGSYFAMGYEFQQGRLGPARRSWPVDSAMTRSATTSTIVAFVHPRCLCTRATVRQLLRTFAADPPAALLVSVFVPADPANQSSWFEEESIRSIRAAVPTAHILPDPEGVEAQRFGAFTSGTILVYDRLGHEVFRGGITNRRGGGRR